MTVGDRSFLGSNATIRDGITTARECAIGAGAVITRDTRERGVYAAPPSDPAADDKRSPAELLTEVVTLAVSRRRRRAG